nr:hypothetical protein [uncultured Sellimonas sp.]
MAIRIGEPYIEQINNKVRLCTKISGSMNDVLYYEVDKKYEEYLCADRGDAFLVGLLHSAMFNNEDIVCECKITEQLLFQLNMYYIPIISRNMKDLYSISIKAETTNTLEHTGIAVGTGLSGGVDSFYTVTKYSAPEMGNWRVTHLLFNNIVTADDNEERIRFQHNKDVEEKRKIAEEMGLQYIDLYSNLYAFYRHPGIFNHYFTLQYASAVLAMQKLFHVFYFSSSYELEDFSVDYNKIPSGAPFDLFTLKCVSGKNLTFYSAGTEVSRYQKMEAFVDNETVKKHLQVCGVSQDFGGHEPLDKLNCGNCMKCSRAIVSLKLLGRLNDYIDIFDMTRYRKSESRFIGRELAGDKGCFVREIENTLKEKNMMSIAIRFWQLCYSVKFKLSKNKFLRDIVYKMRKQ